jgi:hypothetical protein
MDEAWCRLLFTDCLMPDSRVIGERGVDPSEAEHENEPQLHHQYL